ncbi:MAG: hypothetical protein AAF211_13905 [Myxococcota bacterium]
MQHWVVWGVAAASLPVFVGSRCSAPDDASNIRVENQHWAQRAPKDARDMVNWLSIVDDSETKYGAAQRRSAYRWLGEAFFWKRDGKKLVLSFPQSNQRVSLDVKPYACKRGVFDRCLDVTWRGRTVTLYSMEDLRIRDGADRVSPLPPLSLADDGCPRCVEGTPDSLADLFREALAE